MQLYNQYELHLILLHGHLLTTNLFLLKNFAEYSNKFPENFVSKVGNACSFLKKTKVQVIYEGEKLESVSRALPHH